MKNLEDAIYHNVYDELAGGAGYLEQIEGQLNWWSDDNFLSLVRTQTPVLYNPSSQPTQDTQFSEPA